MCTVSWARTYEGYELFFNRDERKTRGAELPPAQARRAGVAFIAPWDGERGGTWLATNEFGLTICLLNDYAATWRPTPADEPHSRGHIVTACTAAGTRVEVLQILRAQPLIRTPAFRLVALSRDEAPLMASWSDGVLRYDVGRKVSFLSSSSFATDEVVAYRGARYTATVRHDGEGIELSSLAALHHEHDRTKGAHSVLMHRNDAATRSITHVAVDSRGVKLRYQPVRWTDVGPVFERSSTVFLPVRAALGLAA